MKIQKKLVLMFIVLITIISVSIFWLLYSDITNMANSDYIKIIESNSKLSYAYLDKAYPGDWNVKDNKLYKGNILINDNSTIIDFIKEQTDSLVTIFLNDTRVCTNVIDESTGERALGTKASQEIINTVLENGDIFLGKTRVLGRDILTKYTPIKDAHGNIIGMWFIGIDCSTVSSYTFNIIVFTGIMLLLFTVLGIIAFTILGSIIVKSIHKFNRHLSILSNGDFTVPVIMKELNRKDEIGSMFKDLSFMQNKIKAILKNVESQATVSAETSNDLYLIIKELKEIVDEISITTEQIAAGLEETAASTQEVNATTFEIEKSIEEISNEAKQTVLLSKEIKNKANNLKFTSIDSQDKALKIYDDNSNKLLAAIDESQKVTEITTLLDSILGICKQTNLLSLNAAIEANKAGEAGNGFAVVAIEIKKLAQDSNDVTTKVKDITSLVISAVENLVNSSMDLLNFVDQTVIADYNELVKISESYSHDADYYDNVSQSIQNTTDALLVATKDIISAINNVAISASEGANDSVKIAQRINDLSIKCDDLVISSKKCEMISNDLTSSINKLKL